MSRLQAIPRSSGFADLKTSPGWWIGTLDGQLVVHLRCGKCCKHTGTLDHHAIDSDGTVHPSILCGDCGWHVFGKLKDWKGTKKPGRPPAIPEPQPEPEPEPEPERGPE